MNLRVLLSRQRNRFVVAIAAAVVVHVCALVIGNLGMLWNAIPSDHSRVLTLTLHNTAEQGLHADDTTADETRNQVQQEQAQNVKPREEDGELVSAETLNADGELQANSEPEVQESQVSQSVADDVQQTSASPIGEQAVEGLQSTSTQSNIAEQIFDNPALSDTPLFAALDGNVSISLSDSAPDQQIADKIEVTESEQRMLDQKIKFWSENMDSIADTSESLTWQEQGQTFVASFSRKPASGDMDLDEVLVEIKTEKDGKHLSTELTMKKLAFSNFGQFVHRWDKNISLHDDEMTGRFHSNTKFNLEYSRDTRPTFIDKVTTGAYRVNLNGPTSKKNVFLGGLETGVKRIEMPKPRLLFQETQATGRDNTVFIESSARLTFLSDGAVLVEKIKAVGPPEKIVLGESPTYFFSSPKAQLFVRGVVNGAVAVYSPNRIIIEGNILYQSFDPLEDGGDFLGLVSGRQIVIAPRRVTGRGDLTVHAAIYARSRFVVTQTRGSKSGVLTVHGSVSAGSLSATEPRYATKIVFDKRLEDVRPPGFPVTDRYELASSSLGWSSESLPEQEIDWFEQEIESDQAQGEALLETAF